MAAAVLGGVMSSGPSSCTASLRLFFALWPDDAVRRELVSAQQAWRWPRGARLTPPARLHLTLHFLAQVPRERVVALMDGVDVPRVAFGLRLDQAGTWPNGVAWLRPSEVPVELLALHGRIGTVLQALGCPLETRRYEPHVTLAREARGAAAPAVAGVDWRVDGYVLVASQLGAGGGYELLRSYPAPLLQP